jgi:hypothetical protein
MHPFHMTAASLDYRALMHPLQVCAWVDELYYNVCRLSRLEDGDSVAHTPCALCHAHKIHCGPEWWYGTRVTCDACHAHPSAH